MLDVRSLAGGPVQAAAIADGDVMLDDQYFDAAAVAAGAWAPGSYGPDDQRGTFNEVTPARTARALALLDLSRPVVTYNLSETLFNGFPAFGDRTYEQTLHVMGFQPSSEFAGILAAPEPVGPSLISSMEERVSMTYNMGTKINGLHHVGVGGTFYNGLRGVDIARTWGTTRLGNETQGPIVTRGVLVDVLGHKQAVGADDVIEVLPHGRPMLREGYRITVEDIESTLAWEGVDRPIGPGDVVLLRCGWRELITTDPARYLSMRQPGIFLRECRYLGVRRPAIVGIDVWYFGVAREDGTSTMMCHQELPGRFGVRVGEAVPSDDLSADGVFEFVFIYNPQNAKGAISGSAPPVALGQPPFDV
jgi:kynurenine formamidase